MKLAHFAELRVFSYEREDEKKIAEKLKELVPDDRVKLNQSSAEGFNERKIKIFEIRLEKDSQINKFLLNLTEKLSREQKELLAGQAESRLDSEFNFFLRLDKEKLLENKYWVTDSGNCFHVKIVIACFPRTREKALDVVRNLFK